MELESKFNEYTITCSKCDWIVDYRSEFTDIDGSLVENLSDYIKDGKCKECNSDLEVYTSWEPV